MKGKPVETSAEVKRVMAVGHCLAIPLPKWWLKEKGLGKGSELVIIANGELWLIPPHSGTEEQGSN